MIVTTQKAPPLTWALRPQGKHIRVHLAGALTRDSLLSLYSQQSAILAELAGFKQIEWDLANLGRIDSAGFALLCELLHQCQHLAGQTTEPRTIHLINCPSQVLTLSDLFNLATWLQQFLVQSHNNMEIENGNSRN